MKVTTRKWTNNLGPALWDVLIDGKPIGTDQSVSRGRVLQMGSRFIPILDGHDTPLAPLFTRRVLAAEYVVRLAARKGVI